MSFDKRELDVIEHARKRCIDFWTPTPGVADDEGARHMREALRSASPERLVSECMFVADKLKAYREQS